MSNQIATGYSGLMDAREYLRALGRVMDRHAANLDTRRCRECRKAWPCPTMRDVAPAFGIDLAAELATGAAVPTDQQPGGRR